MDDRIYKAIEKEKEIWRPLDEKDEYHSFTTITNNYEVMWSYWNDYKRYYKS